MVPSLVLEEPVAPPVSAAVLAAPSVGSPLVLHVSVAVAPLLPSELAPVSEVKAVVTPVPAAELESPDVAPVLVCVEVVEVLVAVTVPAVTDVVPVSVCEPVVASAPVVVVAPEDAISVVEEVEGVDASLPAQPTCDAPSDKSDAIVARRTVIVTN